MKRALGSSSEASSTPAKKGKKQTKHEDADSNEEGDVYDVEGDDYEDDYAEGEEDYDDFEDEYEEDFPDEEGDDDGAVIDTRPICKYLSFFIIFTLF
jgi:hypothetical protein